MKIIRTTPDQLILENNPIWLAVFLTVFALVFFSIGLSTFETDRGTAIIFMAASLGMGIGFNMLFIRRTQLILDRARNLVELRRRSWFGYKRWEWELRFLDHAELQSSYSKDTNTHRAALVITGGMDAGTHPVTLTYYSGRAAQRGVDAINAWLDSARPPA